MYIYENDTLGGLTTFIGNVTFFYFSHLEVDLNRALDNGIHWIGHVNFLSPSLPHLFGSPCIGIFIV